MACYNILPAPILHPVNYWKHAIAKFNAKFNGCCAGRWQLLPYIVLHFKLPHAWLITGLSKAVTLIKTLDYIALRFFAAMVAEKNCEGKPGYEATWQSPLANIFFEHHCLTVFLMLSYIQVSVLSCPCYFFKFGKSLLHFSWLQLSLRHLPSEAVFSRGCLLCCYCSGSAFVWFYLMVE